MSKLVTIYGGSGFVGRYVVRRMAQAGWRVRVAVRRPNEALFLKTCGTVGQVEPVLCNIRDEQSVRAAMVGADAVVNCVGLLNAIGKNRFDAVQAEGAGRIARLAAEGGVARLVHISAIGADAGSNSAYSETKGLGETLVQDHFPNAVILRPSVIFGPEDRFFNRFAAMVRFTPMLALVGAKTKFQPVYVDDVAQAAQKAVLGADAGIYELGGPEILRFDDMMKKMLAVIHRRRLVVGLPLCVGRMIGFGADMVQAFSLGLIENKVLTRDQVRNLARDNVVHQGAKGFADLGIAPACLDAVLPGYLWPYRPAGQYDDIKASARNLKKV